MIALSAGVRIVVARRPVDFRNGLDGLAALVQQALRENPFAGDLFVFRAKRADRVKIVTWDGTGLVMLWKALDEGAFKWPPISDGVMKLSPAQLSALLEGLDWTRVHPPRTRRPTAVR
jgi:transposase